MNAAMDDAQFARRDSQPVQVAEPLEIVLNGSSTVRRVLAVERTFLGQIKISVRARTRKGSPGRFTSLAYAIFGKSEVVQKISLHRHDTGWYFWAGDMLLMLADGEAEKLIDAFAFRVVRDEAHS